MMSTSGTGDQKKNFLEADGSLFRKTLLLDEETLRKVGYEGPIFEAENLEDDNLSHIMTPSQAQDAKQCKFIIPEPGKCLKTKDIKSSQKAFINICHSDKVPEPPIYFSEDQLRKLLQEGVDEDLDDVRIPMSIGAKRIDKDRNGVICQAYDIIINTTFYKKKILTSDLYWTFLCVVSMEALDEKYKVELNKNDYIVMKHKACHGKPQPQFVRDKPEIREVSSTITVPSVKPTGKSGRPLIEEIPDIKSNPTVKPPQKKIDCEPRPVAKKTLQESMLKEVSTKVYKEKVDFAPDLPQLKVTVFRNKGSKTVGTAFVDLPGLQRKDYGSLITNCSRDIIEIISIVGKCRVKVPINITSFFPEFNYSTGILKLNLKLSPMDAEMIKEWKGHGHDLPEFDSDIKEY